MQRLFRVISASTWPMSVYSTSSQAGDHRSPLHLLPPTIPTLSSSTGSSAGSECPQHLCLCLRRRRRSLGHVSTEFSPCPPCRRLPPWFPANRDAHYHFLPSNILIHYGLLLSCGAFISAARRTLGAALAVAPLPRNDTNAKLLGTLGCSSNW